VIQGLKYGLGDAAINDRPIGQSHGFPSGHTAAAASGATDLALHCAPGDRAVAAASAAAIALVAGSRVGADEHTVLQVVAGAALGALSTVSVSTRRRAAASASATHFRSETKTGESGLHLALPDTGAYPLRSADKETFSARTCSTALRPI